MGTYSGTFPSGITITNAGQLPVTIASGAYVGNNTPGGRNSVFFSSTTLFGTIFNFGTIATTVTDYGVHPALQNGIKTNAGGYIYNGTTGVIDVSGAGIYLSGVTVSTVTNLGVITANNHLGGSHDQPHPSGVGVTMNPAGTLTNGSASLHTALIEGNAYGATVANGTVRNFATIEASANTTTPGDYGSGFGGSGVYGKIGSHVLNYQDGRIFGKSNGVVTSGTDASIVNQGTISAATATAHGTGIRLTQGGGVNNDGLISGVQVGIGGYSNGYNVTADVVNSGTIVATGTDGIGISLAVVGATVINSGTISGSGGVAVSFGNGSGTNLLILENGSVLQGAVHGGASSTDILELSGSSGSPATVNYNSLFLTNWDDVLFSSNGNAQVDVTNTAGTVGVLVQGFTQTSDVIHLTGITNGTISNFNHVDNLVTITGTGGSVTLKLDGSDSAYLTTSPDGLGGTDVSPACFCRGTLIRTPDGEVAVDELAIGDSVMTQSGAARPVKWVGRRAYRPRFVAGKRHVLPIRIAAGALGDGVPARDLWLSPQHAVAIGEVLVPAELLLNGTTVTQADSVDDVLDYFHVELQGHDILFAEGAAAESYVDCDNRLIFANAAEHARLYPEEERPRWQFCAPRLEAGSPELAAIRNRMAKRATAFGHPGLGRDPAPRLMVDGKVLRPFSLSPLVHRFSVPAGAREIWLLSRSTVPAYVEAGSPDTRRLGLPVECLMLRDGQRVHETWHGQLASGEGFHQDEGTHCWTDGRARLPPLRPLARQCTLEVRLIATDLCYPKLPPATAGLGQAASGERHMAGRRSAIAG